MESDVSQFVNTHLVSSEMVWVLLQQTGSD